MKPCGGHEARRPRAAGRRVACRRGRHAPFELQLGYRRRFERSSEAALVLMTRRRRLDAFLAEQGAAAGAVFLDGVTVEGLTIGPDGATLRVTAPPCTAASSSARDGVNGWIARDAGLGGGILPGSRSRASGPAPRGTVGARDGRARRRPRRLRLESSRKTATPTTASAAGSRGPRLREHLSRLCLEHGVDAAQLTDLEGRGCRSAGRRARRAGTSLSSETRPGSSTRSRTGSTRPRLGEAGGDRDSSRATPLPLRGRALAELGGSPRRPGRRSSGSTAIRGRRSSSRIPAFTRQPGLRPGGRPSSRGAWPSPRPPLRLLARL